MTNYKHIFFDLDRTLWDFDYNSKKTLKDIYNYLNLNNYGIKNFKLFISVYKKVNYNLWIKYRDGVITKQELRSNRFKNTLSMLGLNDKLLAKDISSLYIQNSPVQTKLMPNAKKVLNELKKNYKLHIITNGFKEVQIIKMKKSGLINYFENIIISEEIGYLKPNKKIFLFALKLCNANKEESLMVGDDLKSDIYGAMQVGIDQVFYNYKNKSFLNNATYEINNLLGLLNII